MRICKVAPIGINLESWMLLIDGDRSNFPELHSSEEIVQYEKNDVMNITKDILF